MKIGITGSQGYIGSKLLPHLESKGHSCIGFDTAFFEDCLLPTYSQNAFTSKDVREIRPSDIKNLDVLIHLAGIANDPFGKLEPSKVFDPVREYTKNLAIMCKSLGIKFIFASSCSIYGDGTSSLLDESSVPNPVTPYSVNKLQSEKDLEVLADENFSPIALRLSTLFGMSPCIRFDMAINMFVGMAHTKREIVLSSTGEQWRPFIHINDVCKAFRLACESSYDRAKLLILNVGSDSNNITVFDVAKMVASKFNNCQVNRLVDSPELDNSLLKDEKLQDGVDKRNYIVSFKKIDNQFSDFKCEWSLERGIDDLKLNFERLELSSEIFHDSKYYRLQYLDYLYLSKKINEDMKWIKD